METMSQGGKRGTKGKQTGKPFPTYILAVVAPNQRDRLAKVFATSRASHRLPKTLRQLHLLGEMCCKKGRKKGWHYVMYVKLGGTKFGMCSEPVLFILFISRKGQIPYHDQKANTARPPKKEGKGGEKNELAHKNSTSPAGTGGGHKPR